MLWAQKFWLRLQTLFRRNRSTQRLNDEIQFHLDQQFAENLAAGMSPEEARHAAKRTFGNTTFLTEETRDTWGWLWLEQIGSDLRYATRILRKSPGFTLVAMLTLALGIGAHTAMFSVVRGVVLAPLPYFQPDRLVMLLESNQRFSRDAISYPNFVDWQRSAGAFDQMAAIMLHQGYDLSGPGSPEHLDGVQVTAGFFSTLGVRPSLGREFSPQEDQHGGSPVVIISNRLWRNRFGASPQALGKSLILSGTDYVIVGVLPAGFCFLDEADAYLPLGQYNPLLLEARGSHAAMVAVARLKPGVSVAQAQSEMSAIQDRLDQLYPDADRGTGADVEPLKQIVVQDVRGTLLLLLGAVGLVLLIMCANVANLCLARSAAREREFAVRVALGASRARVVRQLLTESLLLSLAGGALGVLLAFWSMRLLLAAIPGNVPRSENIGVNAQVLWFTFGVSLAVGILFGLAPALESYKPDVQASLKESGRGAAGARHRAQSTLLVVQTALALVLLVGAGLLLRTIRHLWETNPGFDTQNLITFKIGLSPSASKTGPAMRASYLQLLDRIRAIPGVQAADFTELVPLTDNDADAPFWIDSQKPAEIQNAPRTLVFATGTDYLRTMGIPLLRGRFFTPKDTLRTPFVTVIDTVFAEQYFPGQNPVGQSITFGWDTPVGPCEIVGVVGHVSHWGVGETDKRTRAQSYFSLYQDPDKWVPLNYPDTKILVRTPLDVAIMMPAIRSAVYAAGSAQPVYSVKTMPQIVAESMSSQRFPMILLATFAALALILASVGTYGVVAYSVSQRLGEIGIRMALGAAKQDVFRMVIGNGLRLACTGLAIGIVVALVLARLLSNFAQLLYGVRANDPLTLLGVSVVLMGVALLASYVPARRATRVDPMVALRYE
ncbi:MAG TPA: ABC transporter permease [Candidatus Acidoferrum sp.]|nr:ABC transporter permease [Candidatus Acidoferrum sp.]